MISRAFFDVLDLIEQNNSELVIVSGRSLSWGHFLLTHFPLRSAIMEAGGVILNKCENGLIKHEALVEEDSITKMRSLTEELLKEHPGTILSPDSMGRLVDRAFEYHYMSEKEAQGAEQFLEKNNVEHVKSSVHVNFWIGEVSKYKGVKTFLEKFRPDVPINECLYFGDSLNDVPMFEKFPNSIGVANISKVINAIPHRPKVILEGKENEEISGVYSYLSSFFSKS